MTARRWAAAFCVTICLAHPAHAQAGPALDWRFDPLGQIRLHLPRFEPRPYFHIAAIEIPPQDVERIGRRIWQNECGGTVSGLTSWNQGEAFASLGIGHFIWYPAGPHGPFQESFPLLLEFLAGRGVSLPDWLAAGPDCPWSDRDAFYRDIDSPRMRQLRELLAATVSLQARFIVDRMEAALPKMLASLPPEQREPVRRQFYRAAAEPLGVYGLVDYVNFKGEGTDPEERYRGEGWGLLQVLQGMSGAAAGQAALDEYSLSAERVLVRRVANSPPERNEARWLPGWKARVRTYRTGPL
jgi:hypothetical protein